jgi:hypothetical protein
MSFGFLGMRASISISNCLNLLSPLHRIPAKTIEGAHFKLKQDSLCSLC